jgi:hypothetical protein
MINSLPNLCIRCGKPRIITKTWKEGGLTFSTAICPDKECQKQVDETLRKKKEHLDRIKENSRKRLESKKSNNR